MSKEADESRKRRQGSDDHEVTTELVRKRRKIQSKHLQSPKRDGGTGQLVTKQSSVGASSNTTALTVLNPLDAVFAPSSGGLAAFDAAFDNATVEAAKLLLRDKAAQAVEIEESLGEIASRVVAASARKGISDEEMEQVSGDWIRVRTRAADHRSAMDRLISGQSKVYEVFGMANVQIDFQSLIDVGSTTWKDFCGLALVCEKQGIDYSTALRYILKAQLDRVSRIRSRKSDIPQATDFRDTKTSIKNGMHIRVELLS